MESTNYKTYVSVDVHVDTDGKITPLAIIWEDGRRFEIDRVSDIRYAASMGYVHAPIGALDELLMDLQPGSLKRSAGRELSDREIDALRAERLRRRLEEIGRMD